MSGANGPLPALRTLVEWKKGTFLLMHARSNELQAVDVALERYEQTPPGMPTWPAPRRPSWGRR